MLTRTIDAWIDIEASTDRIWEVLVDFPKWSIWNPFIPLVEGKLQGVLAFFGPTFFILLP